MSAFIHPENQKLLWGIISNQAIFNQVYSPGNPYREMWFRNIIERFYNANKTQVFSSDQLLNFNREVIRNMINILKGMVKSNNPISSVTPVPYPPIPIQLEQKRDKEEPITTYTRNVSQDSLNKQEVYNIQFNERQKQYEQMIARPLPPEVKFEEVVKDEAITNMEELIKKHNEQRERELQNIMRSSNFNSIVDTNPTKPNSIKINGEIDVDVEAQPISIELVEEKSKKTVSWSENLENNETILRQQNEIQELKEQMADIKREIRSLKEILLTNNAPMETTKVNKKPMVDVNLV
jgi:hypothetical protein